MYLPSGGQTASRALLTGGRGLRILARHLDELRLLGQSEGTIYARRRAVLRMASLIGTPLLEATPEDLGAWRAALDVTENTVVHYASDARQFFDWCVKAGLREDNPAAGLLVPVLSRGLPRPVGEDPLFASGAGAPGPVPPGSRLAGSQARSGAHGPRRPGNHGGLRGLQRRRCGRGRRRAARALGTVPARGRLTISREMEKGA